MSITTDELNRFYQFAVSMVSQGQDDLSLGELVAHWQQVQERASANDSIRQSLSEFEAGQGQPVREFLDEMKSKYDIVIRAPHAQGFRRSPTTSGIVQI